MSKDFPVLPVIEHIGFNDLIRSRQAKRTQIDDAIPMACLNPGTDMKIATDFDGSALLINELAKVSAQNVAHNRQRAGVVHLVFDVKFGDIHRLAGRIVETIRLDQGDGSAILANKFAVIRNPGRFRHQRVADLESSEILEFLGHRNFALAGHGQRSAGQDLHLLQINC